MSSLWREPGEDSSNSSESSSHSREEENLDGAVTSDNHEEEHVESDAATDSEGEHAESDAASDSREEEPAEGATSPGNDQSIPARINTTGTAPSVLPGQTTPPLVGTAPRTQAEVKDLLLHSLLEAHTIQAAAKHLGKDENDPEVQRLANSTYRTLSRQLQGTSDIYNSDLMRPQRASVQDVLATATRQHLTAMTTGNIGPSRILTAEDESVRVLSELRDKIFGLTSRLESSLKDHPGLHTDRYVREFSEEKVVGKGGFGTVFRVRHRLDNSHYAVKRIKISQKRLEKIQKKDGAHEFEKILEEVRALAKFDHGNIVRYHNCWLEFTTSLSASSAPRSSSKLVKPTLRLKDAASVGGARAGVGKMSLQDRGESQVDSGQGISFGYDDEEAHAGAQESVAQDSDKDAEESDTCAEESDTCAEESHGEKELSSKAQRHLPSSQAVIATRSSARSHLKPIKSDSEDEDDEDEDDEDEDDDEDDDDEEESTVSDSDVPNKLVSGRTPGPILTLNVQMSLYDTDLALFLSPGGASFLDAQLEHCFHTCISLEFLFHIISGVEYLHDQGVVHRDLKPANVFLSISTSKVPPSGSVNLAACPSCAHRSQVYLTPKIGDFGLVAAMGAEVLKADSNKSVGTKLYRPASAEVISEKLDVYSLGVIAFEMLERFSTGMERVIHLSDLRQSKFPKGFEERVGSQVFGLLQGMVHGREGDRLGCGDVKLALGELIKGLKPESRFSGKGKGKGKEKA